MQLEVVSALLSENTSFETVVKEPPSFIWSGRSKQPATPSISRVPPNPFWASIGLSVTPLAWLRCTIREPGFAGILEPEFSKRCQGWYPLRAEQGLFGWNVTDCKICFEYGLYYSPVSTPADFRHIGPAIVLEQGIEGIGTQLLEPYLSFILYAPRNTFRGLS